MVATLKGKIWICHCELDQANCLWAALVSYVSFYVLQEYKDGKTWSEALKEVICYKVNSIRSHKVKDKDLFIQQSYVVCLLNQALYKAVEWGVYILLDMTLSSFKLINRRQSDTEKYAQYSAKCNWEDLLRLQSIKGRSENIVVEVNFSRILKAMVLKLERI